ncbi:MAG: ATP-dependent protease ATPase subunit HslU [Spirochaetaceae bacterium]
MRRRLEELTPKEIVAELDRYIIGQEKAKKAVAIALRNRVRRQRLEEELQDEIAPKNIIMIGPTGVGKTEIARRLSKLTGAPFIKVEATKYTEVGYVGRDVESMVRDLTANAVTMVKSELQEEVREEAERRTEEILLDLLLPDTKENGGSNSRPMGFGGPRSASGSSAGGTGSASAETGSTSAETAPAAAGDYTVPTESGTGGSSTREKFRKMLREGKLEEKEVDIEVSAGQGFPAIEIFSGSNFEEMDLNLGGISNLFGGKKKKKRTTIRNAREEILQQETEKLVDNDRVSELARERVEQMGIIFIDEIDKIAAKENRSGTDVSREGVQRDILPIVEGSTVNTKYGMVDTSHILFIAAGAFHMSKPSDLIPELQGRFPLRVELEALGAEDFYRILTQPRNALITQYRELLKTEGVEIDFTEEAIRTISEIAAEVNSRNENIGARRLHTIMELLLEEVSFTAPELTGQTIPVTPEYVHERLGEIVEDQDLSRYIL